MKTKIENIEDYDLFTDENGNVVAELKIKSLAWDHVESKVAKYAILSKYQYTKESAKKVLLFSQIQAIADYANDGWVANWIDAKQDKWAIMTLCGDISIDYLRTANSGTPVFKSNELAQQAYNENEELFDEFFNL